LLWIRELIDAGSISEFRWIDTRDMTADGHTKGSVPRTALQDVARGYILRSHPHKAVKAKPKVASVVVNGFVAPVSSHMFFFSCRTIIRCVSMLVSFEIVTCALHDRSHFAGRTSFRLRQPVLATSWTPQLSAALVPPLAKAAPLLPLLRAPQSVLAGAP